MKIPFNKSNISEEDLENISSLLFNEKVEGGESPATNFCINYLKENFNIKEPLLTTSCTAALDLIALLLNLKAGDEIIMPSYTFVSTANAFALRGCTPVFVDVRKEDFNLDLDLVERAINKKTKALVVVHYGGVACDMEKAKSICRKYNLKLIEDAAQAVGSKYKNRYLGTIGDMGAYSFHGTKNITCGEGGAILINKSKYQSRANILYEKGTNRSDFSRGKVSKYNWQDIGSSFILSNFSAFLLKGQLRNEKNITNERLDIWNYYYDYYSSLEDLENKYRLLEIPGYAKHNGHLFGLVFHSKDLAQSFLRKMRTDGYEVSKHYVALHSSPYGKKISKTNGDLKVTHEAENCFIRLPIWPGIEKEAMLQASRKILAKL